MKINLWRGVEPSRHLFAEISDLERSTSAAVGICAFFFLEKKCKISNSFSRNSHNVSINRDIQIRFVELRCIGVDAKGVHALLAVVENAKKLFQPSQGLGGPKEPQFQNEAQNASSSRERWCFSFLLQWPCPHLERCTIQLKIGFRNQWSLRWKWAVAKLGSKSFARFVASISNLKSHTSFPLFCCICDSD